VKPAKEKPARHIDWARFFKRYTLIYPTDTVWDADYRKIVKLAHVKIDRGDGAGQGVAGEPRSAHRQRGAGRVRSSGTCGEECINLFNGMPVSRRGGIVRKAHRAAAHLCGEAGGDMPRRRTGC
jgi:hypothetical protein